MGRPQDVWWYLNHTPKEATYGAGVTGTLLTKFFKLTAPSLWEYDLTNETDEDEIKGHPYCTDAGAVVVESRTKQSVDFKGNADLIAHMIISMLANVSTAGTPPANVHSVKWPGTAIDGPWSFSVIQGTDRNQATSFYQYNGVVCNSFEMTVEKPGSIACKAELLGDGSHVDASAIVAPAINSAIEGDRLFYENLSILIFGSAGTESMLPLFRKLVVKVSADVQQVTRPDKTVNVAEVHYGPKAPTLEVELTVKGRKGDTVWNLWKNQTKCIFEMQLTKTAAIYINLHGHAVRAASCKESFNGIDHVLTLPLRFEYVTADVSPYLWKFANTNTAYFG